MKLYFKMMNPILLENLQNLLNDELSNWQLKDNALERTYHAESFLKAVEMLNLIARHAEAANHHPGLVLHWKTLTIRYWTHSVNRITTLDVEQARQVEQLFNP